jgi:hypothetical protein
MGLREGREIERLVGLDASHAGRARRARRQVLGDGSALRLPQLAEAISLQAQPRHRVAGAS